MPNWLNPELLAQEVHGAIGFGFFLAIWYRVRPFGIAWMIFSFIVFLAVVLGKEILWDPTHEVGQPFIWAGARDFAFYLVGISAGAAIVFL